MKSAKITIVFLTLLCCSLLLVGCKDTEKEEAVVEAAAAQTELAKMKANLASIMSERDNLKLQLTTVIKARDKLQKMVGQASDIKDQLAGLTKERDEAFTKAAGEQTMVETLKSQLNAQIQKVAGLEAQNGKLQGMIDELKKNLGSGVETPSIPGL